MDRKMFKYENKNKKKIRVKDILMLLSVFALCVITVITSGKSTQTDKKTSVQTETQQPESIKSEASIPVTKNNNPSSSDVQTATLNDYNAPITPADEISYEVKLPLSFISPVKDGAIIKAFSPKELLYSKTMDDWRTHNGIDISCTLGTDVVSSEKGTVTKVNYDINYGNSVTIEHGEYSFIYTSLSSDIYVNEGDRVSKGDLIGKTSDSCMSEICDDPHIHLEVLKNNEYINPVDIIEFK